MQYLVSWTSGPVHFSHTISCEMGVLQKLKSEMGVLQKLKHALFTCCDNLSMEFFNQLHLIFLSKERSLTHIITVTLNLTGILFTTRWRKRIRNQFKEVESWC